MDKVLFVSYGFAPSTGPNSVIGTKFVKHFNKFNWSAEVLTVPSRKYENLKLDDNLVDEVNLDHVNVHRVNYPNYPKALRKLQTRSMYGQATSSSKKSSGFSLKRIAKFILSIIINPDKEVLWIPFAVLKGYRLIKKENISVIHARALPASALLVGVILKKLTKKPCVIEFTEYWTLRNYIKWTSKVQRSIQMRMEKWVIKNADTILTGFDPGYYDSVYPGFKKKTALNVHGFDSELFDEQAMELDKDYINIVYTGKIKGDQYPIEPLLNALSKLKESEKIKLIFVGNVEEKAVELIKSFEKLNIEVIPPVPHKMAVQYMKGADQLLLIINDTGNNLVSNFSTKVFEYLAAKKPILGLVPTEGKAAELIQQTNSGVVCSPNDEESIQTAIQEIMSKKWDISTNDIKMYNRVNVVERLVKEYNKLCVQ